MERFLGRGGMGEVFEAWDEELAIPVALKTLFDLGAREGAVRNLKREVLLARSVSHPHVCRVYDLGRHGGGADAVWFLSMELLPGESLRERLVKRGRFSTDEALPLAEQMAAGLHAAHRAGVVHGDFKSGNVMLVEGSRGSPDPERAVVTDFGLARDAAGTSDRRRWLPKEKTPEKEIGEVTTAMLDVATASLDQAPGSGRHELIMGTPAYMAPELFRGDETGPAADIYALGVVLYEMVTGRLPYEGSTPLEVARRCLTEEARSPRELAPDLDERWEKVILRCLSRDPTGRFARAEDIGECLSGRAPVDGLEPGATTVRVRHTLPVERDAFVGRESDLDRIDQGFASGTRLLTLLGTGGMGKTRLAVRYGWQSVESWSGGVWFCDLTEATNANGISSAVAAALNVPLGKGDVVEQLAQALAGRGRCLVILDNFEQVASHAGETVGHWLDRAAEASFLVTSRERLILRGEEVQEVAPLSPESGVDLFTHRAQMWRPGFELTPSSAETVRELVRLVEGMPLAIELGAARVRVMAPEQLVQRMRERFRVLVGGGEGRHATLKAAIDSSWDLLLPWEKAAFAQCSVFEGGFTLEAAEAVLDLTSWADAPWVIDAVQSLLDKSLLRTWVPETGSSPRVPDVRFGMYVSLQEYARDALGREDAIPDGGSGQRARRALEERHGRWYARHGMDDAIEGLHRLGGSEWRRLQHELENLVASCHNAVARGDGLMATAAYRSAAMVLRTQGPFEMAIEIGNEVLAMTLTSEDRAQVLACLGDAERLASRTEQARTHEEAALSIFRQLGHRRHEGSALRNLGTLEFELGRREVARSLYQAALALSREGGDRAEEGAALGALGLLHLEHGHLDEARAGLEAARRIHKELGHRRLEGLVLSNLGILDAQQGRTEEARVHFEEGLAVDRGVGDRRLEGAVLSNLGILHRRQGRLGEASAHFEAALAIHRDLGNRRMEGIALTNLGSLAQDRNRVDEARTYFEAALALHGELGNRKQEGIALVNLATLYIEQGRTTEGRDLLARAEVLVREVGDPAVLVQLLCHRAVLDFNTGQVKQARAAQAEAESLAAQMGIGADSAVQGNLAWVRTTLGPT